MRRQKRRGSALNGRVAGWKYRKNEQKQKRQRTGRAEARPVPMKSEVVREKSPSSGELLELDLGAGRLELLLDFLSFGLGSVLLDRLRCTFDKILRLLEAKTRDGADFLDDAN